MSIMRPMAQLLHGYITIYAQYKDRPKSRVVMENIVVHKDNMLKHTNEFGGIVYSQKVLLSLV